MSAACLKYLFKVTDPSFLALFQLRQGGFGIANYSPVYMLSLHTWLMSAWISLSSSTWAIFSCRSSSSSCLYSSRFLSSMLRMSTSWCSRDRTFSRHRERVLHTDRNNQSDQSTVKATECSEPAGGRVGGGDCNFYNSQNMAYLQIFCLHAEGTLQFRACSISMSGKHTSDQKEQKRKRTCKRWSNKVARLFNPTVFCSFMSVFFLHKFKTHCHDSEEKQSLLPPAISDPESIIKQATILLNQSKKD